MADPRYCSGCRKFLGATGVRCPDSTGRQMPACDRFRAGHPFRPKFNGKFIQEPRFDPTVPAAWAFWISPQMVMMLVWDLDHNQYGHFRCFLLGLDDQGIVQKQFSAAGAAPAFYGEVVCKGPAENDLWSSFGYQDDDQHDSEGNLINKPRELKILPKRGD